MFGRKSKKTAGLAATSAPATVRAELPVLPRPSHPRIAAEEQRSELGLLMSQTVPSTASYVMKFSDGQRVSVQRRCLAGRMPPESDDHYDAYAELVDPTHQVSRHHFEFGVTTVGQVWVMDLDSANGTWLESRGRRTQLTARVRAHMLPGDVVWFGDKWAKLSMTT